MTLAEQETAGVVQTVTFVAGAVDAWMAGGVLLLAGAGWLELVHAAAAQQAMAARRVPPRRPDLRA
jgi:predicted metal-binding membrane protein